MNGTWEEFSIVIEILFEFVGGGKVKYEMIIPKMHKKRPN
jgi:hypothetical protein